MKNTWQKTKDKRLVSASETSLPLINVLTYFYATECFGPLKLVEWIDPEIEIKEVDGQRAFSDLQVAQQLRVRAQHTTARPSVQDRRLALVRHRQPVTVTTQCFNFFTKLRIISN